jgi:hypothetical protein
MCACRSAIKGSAGSPDILELARREARPHSIRGACRSSRDTPKRRTCQTTTGRAGRCRDAFPPARPSLGWRPARWASSSDGTRSVAGHLFGSGQPRAHHKRMMTFRGAEATHPSRESYCCHAQRSFARRPQAINRTSPDAISVQSRRESDRHHRIAATPVPSRQVPHPSCVSTSAQHLMGRYGIPYAGRAIVAPDRMAGFFRIGGAIVVRRRREHPVSNAVSCH